jgi:hypothetical protein
MPISGSFGSAQAESQIDDLDAIFVDVPRFEAADD